MITGLNLADFSQTNSISGRCLGIDDRPCDKAVAGIAWVSLALSSSLVSLYPAKLAGYLFMVLSPLNRPFRETSPRSTGLSGKGR